MDQPSCLVPAAPGTGVDLSHHSGSGEIWVLLPTPPGMGGILKTTPHSLPASFPFAPSQSQADFLANVPGEDVQVAEGPCAQHSQGVREILMLPLSPPPHHHSRALSMLQGSSCSSLAPSARLKEGGQWPSALRPGPGGQSISTGTPWPPRVSVSPCKPSPAPLPSSPGMCLPLPSAQDSLLQTHLPVQNIDPQTTSSRRSHDKPWTGSTRSALYCCILSRIIPQGCSLY